MPISAGTPRAVSVTSRAMIAPVAANGTDTRRISGCTRLRKVPAIIMKTMAIAAIRARMTVTIATSSRLSPRGAEHHDRRVGAPEARAVNGLHPVEAVTSLVSALHAWTWLDMGRPDHAKPR
jgi:hypothetical protein